MKEIFFNDQEYADLLRHLDKLMTDAEGMPYPTAKNLIFEILQYFDSVHREPLARMINKITEADPDLRINLEKDFSIKTLLDLYDLAENPRADDLSKGAKAISFIPTSEVVILTPVKHKEWLELGPASAIEDQKIYARNFEKQNFLVARVGKKVYAMENICQDSILPIDLGKLDGHYVICPWHGCRYDLLTGIAADGKNKKLVTYPTEIEANGILKVELTL